MRPPGSDVLTCVLIRLKKPHRRGTQDIQKSFVSSVQTRRTNRPHRHRYLMDFYRSSICFLFTTQFHILSANELLNNWLFLSFHQTGFCGINERSHCPGECRNTHSAQERRRRYADGGNKIAAKGRQRRKRKPPFDKHSCIVQLNVRNYFRRVGTGEDEWSRLCGGPPWHVPKACN